MKCIDDYIENTISLTKNFNSINTPQLLLIITTLLQRNKQYIDVEKNIKDDGELQELLEKFYDYVLLKIKEYLTEYKCNKHNFNKNDFKKTYDICCRLVILKFKFSKKDGFLCIGKK
jgi:hypothetical protein